MHVDTERALREAHEEIRRRHQWADQERMIRQTADGERQTAEHEMEQPRPSPLDWLRRLAGAR
ncbi:hypothetical protein EKD04_021100 [Chloroflexales bacterium ZM16-3]|nr:hypothetical protein [Chloroflexales bacterium ZM16-3]